jgi:hypothetical protein
MVAVQGPNYYGPPLHIHSFIHLNRNMWSGSCSGTGKELLVSIGCNVGPLTISNYKTYRQFKCLIALQLQRNLTSSDFSNWEFAIIRTTVFLVDHIAPISERKLPYVTLE